MTPTFFERQQLAKEFHLDVERMRRCLEAAGHKIKVDRIISAWIDYSSSVCAMWLGLPDQFNEPELLAILLKHLPSGSSADDECDVFIMRIMDTGDGSGDGVLEMRRELLSMMDWEEGNLLAASINAEGELLLKRKKVK